MDRAAFPAPGECARGRGSTTVDGRATCVFRVEVDICTLYHFRHRSRNIGIQERRRATAASAVRTFRDCPKVDDSGPYRKPKRPW